MKRCSLCANLFLREVFLNIYGLCIVPLAPIRDPELVISTIAQALGFSESGGRPLLQRIKAHLQKKCLLLLLDNVEQVITAAPLLAELLVGCITPREEEVMRLVASGLADAEIADRLVVSTRTVHAHLRTIYSKLGVTSRTAAIHHAIVHCLSWFQ